MTTAAKGFVSNEHVENVSRSMTNAARIRASAKMENALMYRNGHDED
jgi:hypothetical protein